MYKILLEVHWLSAFKHFKEINVDFRQSFFHIDSNVNLEHILIDQ